VLSILIMSQVYLNFSNLFFNTKIIYFKEL
jgi:hypothetical protein